MVSGCATAALSILVWGSGGVKLLSRRITELEDDVLLNQKRLEREVKQRAALAPKSTKDEVMMASMAKLAARSDDSGPKGEYLGV